LVHIEIYFIFPRWDVFTIIICKDCFSRWISRTIWCFW